VKAETKPILSRRAMALAGAAVALAATVVGGTTASAAPVAPASAPIKSGAGPGWPQTLHPSDFVAHVDNRWYPLKPGSRYRYRGVKEGVHMVDKLHVTHRTKTILGVRTTVVHDVILIHGKPREVTDDWYAQDRDGNVWYFGERTKELDPHGNVTSREGSFRAGVDGARAGLFFPGHPRVGQSARQEFYRGHAEDHFKILDRNAPVSVPFVSTRHAIRTKEWTPLEPGVVDNKYYVAGVGTVREAAVKGPVERLRLVSFNRG
jgi:hypothetical protein